MAKQEAIRELETSPFFSLVSLTVFLLTGSLIDDWVPFFRRLFRSFTCTDVIEAKSSSSILCW